MNKFLLSLFSLVLMFFSLSGAEYYVDNVKGNDAGQGTKEAPFKTYTKALKVFKGGDTMHLVHNQNQPYRGRLYLIRCSGTAEKPTVVDGHGAIFDGRTVFPASAWKSEGNGIFCKTLKNNAHVMDYKLGCWSGDFPIVFFDGKDGVNCRKKDELKPFSYFLLKMPKKKGQKNYDLLHNMLYIKLPEGKTPDDIKVETLVDSIGVGVESDYVTVKNIRAHYTGGDCFDTVWKKNIVFDNVEGSYAMDQGISHHGSEVTVKNSWFHHNAGCGIVDVNMPNGMCKSTYINCLIEDNPYRGGVELRGYEHEMINCIVRNGGIVICRTAKAKIKNCLIIGPETPKGNNRGIGVSPGTELEMTDSTVYNFSRGLTQGVWTKGCKIKVQNSAFINCGVAYYFGVPKDSSVKAEFSSNFNYFAPGNFSIDRKKVDFAKYKELRGLDVDSVSAEKYEGKVPPYKIELDKVGKLTKVGAVLQNDKQKK